MLWIFYIWCNCHKTLNVNSGENSNLTDKFFRVGNRNSEFALLFCHIDFNQNIFLSFFFYRFLTDLLSQTKRIYRMDQIHFADNIFYFISLKMPYQMPVKIFGKQFIFIAQLLYLVFTEYIRTCSHGFLYHRYRFGFTDNNQCHFISVSSGTCTCFLYLFIYHSVIFCYHFYSLLIV